MKINHLFTAAGIVLMLAACGRQPAAVTIEAVFTGLPDGTAVTLVPSATHQEEEPVVTATVREGKISLKVDVPEPRMFMLRPGYIRLVTQNGEKITLTGNAVEGERGYAMDDVAIKGSPLTDQYKEKIAPREALNELYTKYRSDNREISEKIGAARGAGDEALLKELMATDAYKKLAADERNFFSTVEATYQQIFKENANSWWGPMLMLDLYSYMTEEQKGDYDLLSGEAQESHYGRIVKKYVDPESFVGRPLPAFALNREEGGTARLSELAKGKKLLLVDFWASWCGPCRREIPNLKALYAQYADKGFEIVGISTDTDVDAWKKAREEEELSWPNFHDDGSAAKACNLRFIPLIFLVDANGTVLAENIRGEELKAKLAELLD